MVYENGPAMMAMARSSASVLRGLLSQRHWSLTGSTVGMETRASSSGTEGGGGEEGPAPGAREKEVGVTVSSLRVDAVASMGLGISRKNIWESFLDGRVTVNGHQPHKKSDQVKEGDIIEVDTPLEAQQTPGTDDKAEAEVVVRRGRVVVKEIGQRTKKGGYRLTLARTKHYSLFRSARSLCTWM